MSTILKNKVFHLLIVWIAFTGCSVNYSMTGASISPDVKTVSIQNFPNYAPLVQPQLSQTFTEKLKNKFVSSTTLSFQRNGGDLNFEGSITNYSTQPVAIQGNETAAQNRLSITILVKFTNLNDEKQNFEQSFTRYADYDSRLQISSLETKLIDQITELIVDDVFNQSVRNW